MDYVPAKILTKQASSTYAPLNLGSDGLSGYAVAIPTRHDRVDYSMTKGGLRQWLTVLLFLILLSGISSFMKKHEVDIESEDLELGGEQGIEQATGDEAGSTFRFFDEEARLSQILAKSEQMAIKKQTESKHEKLVVEPVEFKEDVLQPEDLQVDSTPVLEKKIKSKRKKAKVVDEQKLEVNEPDAKIPEENDSHEYQASKVEREDTEETPVVEDLPDNNIEIGEQRAKTKKKRIKQQHDVTSDVKEENKDDTDEEQTVPNKKRIKPVEVEKGSDETHVKTTPTKRLVKKTQFHDVVDSIEDAIGNAWKIVGSLKPNKARSPSELLKQVEEAPPSQPIEPKIIKSTKTKGKQPEHFQEKEAVDEPPAEIRHINVRKTKGKKLEQEPQLKDQEHSKSDLKDEEKPKIAIKLKRTKGHDAKTTQKKDNVEIIVDSTIDTKADRPKKVKVHYSKGKPTVVPEKPREPEQSVNENCEDSEEFQRCDSDTESPTAEKYSKESNEPQAVSEQSPETQPLKISVRRTKGKELETNQQVVTPKPVEIKKSIRKKARQAHVEPKLINREDKKISATLQEADKKLENRDIAGAADAYENILRQHPNSPLAHYGKARVLDQLSDLKKSNKFLEKSIEEYELILELPDLPSDLFILTATRLVDRLKFRGWLKRASIIQQTLLERQPENLDLLIDYGISNMVLGRFSEAKKIFQRVLKKDPDNGHAMSLYGFLLKTHDGNLEEAVEYLRRGISSGDKASQDARFYFQLGDALQRLNRSEEAYEVYDQGVELGLFLSRYQRSLYNVKGLRAQPWWSLADTTYEHYLKAIENEWRAIRDEGLALMNEDGTFQLEDESLTKEGDWRQFELYSLGAKNVRHCARAPRICALIDRFPAAATCQRGQVKFSVMRGGTRVWPHCGPTNTRLRAHLGLVVPPEPRLRVGDSPPRSWRRGKFIVFDDSFEHEVWYDGTGYRLVLIVDMWHPDLSQHDKDTLSPI